MPASNLHNPKLFSMRTECSRAVTAGDVGGRSSRPYKRLGTTGGGIYTKQSVLKHAITKTYLALLSIYLLTICLAPVSISVSPASPIQSLPPSAPSSQGEPSESDDPFEGEIERSPSSTTPCYSRSIAWQLGIDLLGALQRTQDFQVSHCASYLRADHSHRP
jgi:hypothetical protein